MHDSKGSVTVTAILTSLTGLAWIPISLYRTMRFSIFFQNHSLKRFKEMKEEIKTCFEGLDFGFWNGDLVLFLAQFLGIGIKSEATIYDVRL